MRGQDVDFFVWFGRKDIQLNDRSRTLKIEWNKKEKGNEKKWPYYVIVASIVLAEDVNYIIYQFCTILGIVKGMKERMKKKEVMKMGSETEKEILEVMAKLEKLSKKGIKEELLSLEKQGKILNVNSEKPCTGTGISIGQICGNYVLSSLV